MAQRPRQYAVFSILPRLGERGGRGGTYSPATGLTPATTVSSVMHGGDASRDMGKDEESIRESSAAPLPTVDPPRYSVPTPVSPNSPERHYTPTAFILPREPASSQGVAVLRRDRRSLRTGNRDGGRLPRRRLHCHGTGLPRGETKTLGKEDRQAGSRHRLWESSRV